MNAQEDSEFNEVESDSVDTEVSDEEYYNEEIVQDVPEDSEHDLQSVVSEVRLKKMMPSGEEGWEQSGPPAEDAAEGEAEAMRVLAQNPSLDNYLTLIQIM